MDKNNRLNKLDIHTKELDLILTPLEYKDEKYEIPYILNLRSEDKNLLYFGSEHTNDPDDSQVQLIENSLKQFSDEHGAENIVIVLEDFIPSPNYGKNEMIEKYREQGLLSYLAHSLGINHLSATLSLENLLDYLIELNQFSHQDVALKTFLNVLWGSINKKGRVTEKTFKNTLLLIENKLNINKYSDLAKRLTELIGENILPQKIEDIQKIVFNKRVIKEIQSPFQSMSVLNDIASSMDNVHDRYTAATITELLEKNKNVFAVFGHNHVYAQEPAFRALFKKNG